MEMGKLTAKLRDAVPVCLLVEGKEIKRYKNIEIPDELKKLAYQDFKFDVPATGQIAFKISFAPGVLPEEFPKERERRTRISKDSPVVVVGETPDIAPSEDITGIETDSAEAASQPPQETTALIIIEDAPAIMILKNATQQEMSDEAANPMEVQAAEEATTEDKAVSEVKEEAPAKKAAAKPKKAPAATKTSKE